MFTHLLVSAILSVVGGAGFGAATLLVPSGTISYDDSTGVFTMVVNFDCEQCTSVGGWVDINGNGELDLDEIGLTFSLPRTSSGTYTGPADYVQPGLGTLLLGVDGFNVCFACLTPLYACGGVQCAYMNLEVNP